MPGAKRDLHLTLNITETDRFLDLGIDRGNADGTTFRPRPEREAVDHCLCVLELRQTDRGQE